jgi:hypothetical protein
VEAPADGVGGAATAVALYIGAAAAPSCRRGARRPS